MEAILSWLGANWLYLLGVIFTLVGTFGFLIFLRGMFLGINQLIYIDGHAEHVGHAQTRVTWGFLIMLTTFEWWVLLRAILAAFGVGSVNVGLTAAIFLPYAVIVAAILLRKKE